MTPTTVAGEPLPRPDNELIVGGSMGAVVVPTRNRTTPANPDARVGMAFDVFVGFMKRGTSWADIELALGLAGYWLGGGGFVQVSPTHGRTAREFLPGAQVRGGVRIHTLPGGGGLTVLTGLLLSVYAAPAEGSFSQVSVEFGLGWDALRDEETHFGLELVYGLQLIDSFDEEIGSEAAGNLHRMTVRAGWGF